MTEWIQLNYTGRTSFPSLCLRAWSPRVSNAGCISPMVCLSPMRVTEAGEGEETVFFCGLVPTPLKDQVNVNFSDWMERQQSLHAFLPRKAINSASGLSSLYAQLFLGKQPCLGLFWVKKTIGVLPGLLELGLDLGLPWSSGTHARFPLFHVLPLPSLLVNSSCRAYGFHLCLCRALQAQGPPLPLCLASLC